MEDSSETRSQTAVSHSPRVLAVAFFILAGAGLAFLIGRQVGTSLDRHGRSVTVAHDHVAPPAAPPVAQK